MVERPKDQRLSVSELFTLKMLAPDDRSFTGIVIKDLSKGGLLINCLEITNLGSGDEVELVFYMKTEILFNIKATVCRVGGTLIAAEFLTDEDSLRWTECLMDCLESVASDNS